MLHFSVKKIGGKEYLYAHDKIVVAKGTTLNKYASLGRVRVSDPKAKKEQAFKSKVEKEEVKARAEYWNNKTEIKKCFNSEKILGLEALRGKLYRRKQELGPGGNTAMETAFIIDFIYNSNKIEGSKIPKSEVEKIVRSGSIKKNAEVQNSVRALGMAHQTVKNLSIKSLVTLHKTLLEHEPVKHGLREVPVVVGNSETAPSKEIKDRLNSLFDWYKKAQNKLYPPELAFTFYYKFERIHPFIDGNGRIGRLLMNAILKENRYHPIILWDTQRVAHMSAFERGMEGQIHKFMDFMRKQTEKTYRAYIEKLESAVSIDEQFLHFLKPTRFEQ